MTTLRVFLARWDFTLDDEMDLIAERLTHLENAEFASCMDAIMGNSDPRDYQIVLKAFNAVEREY